MCLQESECTCVCLQAHTRHTDHRVCPIKNEGCFDLLLHYVPIYKKNHWEEAHWHYNNLLELGSFVLFPWALSADSNPLPPKTSQDHFKCNNTNNIT